MESQVISIDLANSISRIKSDTNPFEVIDFEGDYQLFINQHGILENLKNESCFIETFKGKFFKPGVIAFIANFDLGDLLIMNTNFQIYKPDLKILLMITKPEFDKWQMADREDNIECCIHQGCPNKSMMEKLHLNS